MNTSTRASRGFYSAFRRLQLLHQAPCIHQRRTFFDWMAKPQPDPRIIDISSEQLFEDDGSLDYSRLDPSILEARTLGVLRLVPQTVAVVTAWDTREKGHSPVSSSDNGGGDRNGESNSDPGLLLTPCGLTVSSVTSTSMSPPIVSFNIRRPSSTLTAIRRSGRFDVNYLVANRGGVKLARRFTRPDPFSVAEEQRGKETGTAVQTNRAMGYARRGTGPRRWLGPMFRSRGVGAVLACRLWTPGEEIYGEDDQSQEVGGENERRATIRVQDHEVVFGLVEHAMVSPRFESKGALIYRNRQFWTHKLVPVGEEPEDVETTKPVDSAS